MDKLILHGFIEKEDTAYSALCLELDAASQGRSIGETKRNLQETVDIYLGDVAEAKERKDFLPHPAPRAEWIKS